MDDIRFDCPKCHQSLEADPSMRGEAIECPTCRARIVIPSPLSEKKKLVYPRSDRIGAGVQAAPLSPQPRHRRHKVLLVGLPVGAVFVVCLMGFLFLRRRATEPTRGETPEVSSPATGSVKSDAEKTPPKKQKDAPLEKGKPFSVQIATGVSLELVYVDPGAFTKTEDASQYKITLTEGYWIGKHEVTRGQWQAVMKTNPLDDQTWPIAAIGWRDATKFCEDLTDMGRKSGWLPDGHRFALPTKAQWEFAARGGNKTKGYKFSGSSSLDDVAWFKPNSGGKPHAVGKKKPNELGIHDMCGNVWEWCRGTYGHGEWKHDPKEGDLTDPIGGHYPAYRIALGGNCESGEGGCEEGSLCWADPDNYTPDFCGLRVVLLKEPYRRPFMYERRMSTGEILKVVDQDGKEVPKALWGTD